MLDIISIFLNLLRFDLWPKMWPILENVPCALEKKMYSSAFGWNVLKISMRSISSNVSFKTCLKCEWGVEVFYYYCVTVNFSFYVFQCLFHVLSCSYVGCIDIYNCNVFFLDWSFDHYVVSFFVSYDILYFKVYILSYIYCYFCFILISICMEYLFRPLHFQSACVSLSEESLVNNIYGVFFLCIYLANMYILVGEFNPFTFKVIIDIYDPISIYFIDLSLFL